MFDKIIGQLPGLAVGVALGAIATSALTQYYLTSVSADRFSGPARVEPFTPQPVPELEFDLRRFSISPY